MELEPSHLSYELNHVKTPIGLDVRNDHVVLTSLTNKANCHLLPLTKSFSFFIKSVYFFPNIHLNNKYELITLIDTSF